MTHQPHELSNLGLVKQYFDRLSADDISRRYYAGQKYVSSWANRLKFLLFTESSLAELTHFYPYQPIVKRTYEVYKQKSQSYKKTALTFSAVSIFSVYQLARRNYVIPVLTKFGAFLKTHRLLRQYFWLAVLPYTFATYLANEQFVNQAERLWGIHANRLNNKILSDPEDSQYPLQLLPVSQVHTWRPEWVHKYDLSKKWQNEVDLFAAPEYTEIQQWQKVQLAEPEEEGGQEGASGEGASGQGASADGEAQAEQ